MKALFKKVIDAIPYNSFLYKTATLYTNRFSGENGFAFTDDGERLVLQHFAPTLVTAVDAGANLGEWTFLLHQLNPQTEIHSFEPSAPTFTQLRSHSLPPHIHLNHCGLSDTPGHATLHTFGDRATTNSLYPRDNTYHCNSNSTETISLTTLDTYCQEQHIEKIDFLKIDVEGHELPVLRGARQLLNARAIRAIQFEYSNAWSESRLLLKDAYNLLQPLGYRLYKLTGHGCLPLPDYRQKEENYQLKNYLALSSDTALPPGLKL